MYDNIPKRIENNQIGIIVLFLYPMPNSLTLLSDLYRNAGFIKCTNEKMLMNIMIDTNVLLFLIKFLIIYYNYKQKSNKKIYKLIC